MVVYGNPTEIKDFQSKMINAVKETEKTNHWGLFSVYKQFGYTDDYILNSSDNGYIRGNVNYVGKIEILNDKISYISIEYESAWNSMLEGFDFLLKNHYKTLKQFTIAEEPSCEVYINTDENHIFFKEKYVLYNDEEGSNYFESDDKLIEYFNYYLSDKDKVKTVQECFDYLEKNNETLPVNGQEVDASLHEFVGY